MKQILSTIAVIFVLSLTGQAQSMYMNRGNRANASCRFTTGCVSGEITITAGASIYQLGGTKEPDLDVSLRIEEVNNCLNQYFSGEGESDSDLLSFSGNLNSAHLGGDMMIQDSAGNTRLVPVDVTWTGVGKVTRQVTTETFVGGVYIIVTVSTRSATATGTVGGVPVVADSSTWLDESTVFYKIQ